MRAPLPRRWPWRRPAVVPGLYLWGGVGRGKTWLMDRFIEWSRSARPCRMHFHAFVSALHRELSGLRGPDPLAHALDALLGSARLLCLDEFQAVDAGEAALLGGLLPVLPAQGRVLLVTANRPPRALYADPARRAAFEPALRWLETGVELVELGGERDHRDAGRPLASWFDAADPAAGSRMRRWFADACGGPVEGAGRLDCGGRPLVYVARGPRALWCDFDALCGPPRARRDYLWLAERFDLLLLTGVPPLGAGSDDRARRLVHLVDALHDRGVRLGLHAAAPPERLYRGERLAFEFRRTVSRLREMLGAAPPA